MFSGVQDTAGTGTLNPALLSSANTNPGPTLPPLSSPRGRKRSRSPPESLADAAVVDDNGDGKPRKRGRPMKPPSRVGGVPESPTQLSSSLPMQSLPPQTPQQLSSSLPAPLTAVTPTQSSPPKATPTKTTVKALPTVRDHTTDQLGPGGDEYIPREIDDEGEKKVTATGQLNDGRQYKVRTFFVPGRGDKLFMLATECARILNYRDSYLLFNKNRSLYKIIAEQAEKDDLITQGILPYSYRSRQIAIVTARSMFRQFGSRVIVNGRRVRDDYWEAKARKQGFTEADLAGEKRPGGAKARDAAAAEANANAHAHATANAHANAANASTAASAMLSHQGDIVYNNPPPHFVGHLQPQTVQPGMMAPIGGAPLPMITLNPEQGDLRLGEYRNVSRPRQEITGPPYQDRTQTSPPAEILSQAQHAADFNKGITQQRDMRTKYMNDIWRAPHESLNSSMHHPPSSAMGEGLPSMTQSVQSSSPVTSSGQHLLLSNQTSQGSSGLPGSSYIPPPQQTSSAQTPLRNMQQGGSRAENIGRSPNLSLSNTGMASNPNPYAYSSQSPMWASQGHSTFSTYSSQPSHQSPHLQHSPHQAPPQLRHSGNSSQMQPGLQFPGLGQNYPLPGRNMYQTDPVGQQYMQSPQTSQPSQQTWTPQQQQQPSSQSQWNWNTQG